MSLEEKPVSPKSNFAIPGLYIFDDTVTSRASQLKPSKRNEDQE
ncbi:MAG: sugar phosphate nucleotidyltransferase [Aestuariivirga sp.]